MDKFQCENCPSYFFTVQRASGELAVTCINCATVYYIVLRPDLYPWPAPEALDQLEKEE